MELATVPHHSSGMSTRSGLQRTDGEREQQQSTSMTNSAMAEAAGQRTQRQKHKRSTPHKSASDSRVTQSPLQIQSTAGRSRGQSDEEFTEEQEALKYGARHVIHLFIPVSLCMAVVILTMLTVGYYSESGEYLPYTPFHEESDDTGTLLANALGNALIVLFVIAFMTVVLILLYKFRCYKIIHGWLIISSLMLLTLFTISYIDQLFKNYNIPLDWISLVFFVWNWALVGMICIHWKGPLLLQQFYLVVVSALMALLFIKHLPDWTVWAILAIISIWDLVAVLCPKGPLRILVETAHERNEPIFPALIYSSGMMYPVYTLLTAPGETNNEQPSSSGPTEHGAHQQESNSGLNPESLGLRRQQDREGSVTSMDELLTKEKKGHQQRLAPNRGGGPRTAAAASGESANTLVTTVDSGSGRTTPRGPFPRRTASDRTLSTTQRAQRRDEEQEEQGVKLGLGDFIFYSVLVGKASSFGDWNVTIACYVSILVGLAFTLVLLALFRKALPALPISIFLGILFFFCTKLLITPFVSEVSINQMLL